MSEELLRIAVDGGKYTIIQPRHEQVRIERHGEPWMGPGFAGSNAVLALAYELEEAREQLASAEALRGAALDLYMSGRWELTGMAPDVQARLWEALRDALGLEPGAATKAGVHDRYAHRDGSRECRPVPPIATSPFREVAEASAAYFHLGVAADPAPVPHGCPACDDAMECDCQPRLPFDAGATAGLTP